MAIVTFCCRSFIASGALGFTWEAAPESGERAITPGAGAAFVIESRDSLVDLWIDPWIDADADAVEACGRNVALRSWSGSVFMLCSCKFPSARPTFPAANAPGVAIGEATPSRFLGLFGGANFG